MTQCSNCNSAVPTGARFCASCGSAVSPPPRFGEKVYLESSKIKVTNSRLIIADTTYKMANITSFRFKTSIGFLTFVGGVLCVVGVTVAVMRADLAGIALGIVSVAAGAVLAIRSADDHELEILTNAGTVTVFKTSDAKFAATIKRAISGAMAERA